MELIVLGLNHESTPVELREQLSFSKHSLLDALHQALHIFGAAVILSTCNRTEIYTITEDKQTGYTLLTNFLSSFHHLALHDFQSYLYYYTGEQVVHHLFKVASGIDSMILGEPQILGQVRDAFTSAQEAETTDKHLALLFRAALHAGKRVRTETNIAQGITSVSHATVEIARQSLDSLHDKHVAVIGAGNMGQLLALCLKDAGCECFTIVSHHLTHAQALADKYAAYAQTQAHELHTLDHVLMEADLAITSLESPTIVIDRSCAERIAKQRQGKTLYLMDVAVPRNIAAEAGTVPGITLFDIDDLQSLVQANLEQREKEMGYVEQILEEEINNFHEHWHAMVISPIIAALLQKAEDIRQEELHKALPKLQRLTENELNTVHALTTRIINKLLHEPVVGLRRQEDTDYAALISELFLLTVDDPPKHDVQSTFLKKSSI